MARACGITYGGSDIEGSPVFYGRRRYRNNVLRIISRLLSLLVDEVIVVSDHLGQRLPRRTYHVIPSGIDLALFRPIDKEAARVQLGLDPDKRFLLFAGNPGNERKRYALAAQASETAAAAIDHELLVLTGKPSTQLPLYMNASDALILTSTNEGSPNVVEEALACNLPVFSVDVGDVRERIGAVEGCRLCPSDEPDVLADALLSVLQRNRRIAGRETIKELGLANMAARVLAVYRKALGSERLAASPQRIGSKSAPG